MTFASSPRQRHRLAEVTVVAARVGLDAIYLTGYTATFVRNDYAPYFLRACRLVTHTTTPPLHSYALEVNQDRTESCHATLRSQRPPL